MIVLMCTKCHNTNLKPNENNRLFCERCNAEKEFYELEFLLVGDGDDNDGKDSNENLYKYFHRRVQKAVDKLFTEENSSRH